MYGQVGVEQKIERAEYRAQWDTLLQLYLQGKALPTERDKLLDMTLLELNKALIVIKHQRDYLKQLQC